MPVPIFHGRVTADGQLKLDRPKDFRLLLTRLAGKRVELPAPRVRRSRRSQDQNRWHWGVALPLIAHELGYERHEHEQVHYALVAKWAGTTVDERTGLEVPNKRSSRLTTAEFSEFMEWEVRWAATDLGIVVPLPGDVEWPDA